MPLWWLAWEAMVNSMGEELNIKLEPQCVGRQGLVARNTMDDHVATFVQKICEQGHEARTKQLRNLGDDFVKMEQCKPEQ